MMMNDDTNIHQIGSSPRGHAFALCGRGEVKDERGRLAIGVLQENC